MPVIAGRLDMKFLPPAPVALLPSFLSRWAQGIPALTRHRAPEILRLEAQNDGPAGAAGRPAWGPESLIICFPARPARSAMAPA